MRQIIKNQQRPKTESITQQPMPPASPYAVVTGRMLMQLVNPMHQEYSITTPMLDEDDVIIHGSLNNYHCHSGLRVHATDTLEAHDLCTQTTVEPELTIAVFLEGVVNMELDGKPIQLGDQDTPVGHIWSIAKPTPSKRMSKKGTRIRKVLVSAPHHWIAQYINDLQGDSTAISDFMDAHRKAEKWVPSKRVLALCEQILNPQIAPHVIQRMNIESKAIEIFSEGLAALDGMAHSDNKECAPVRAISRGQTIRNYVLEHINDDLALSQIAKDLGMSIETMQRAFKAAFGTTVADFIREHRLHQARQVLISEGVSISEAAYRAGYSNPANFSTAFKKLFGLTPSEAKN